MSGNCSHLRYDLRCVHITTAVSISRRVVQYRRWDSRRLRLAYAMTTSPSFCSWLSTPPTANKLASVSRTKHPSSVGKPRIGAHTRHAFKASKAVCCQSVHTNGTPFLPCQGHQGFRQFCKVLNKSAVVPDKADELSDSFNFIRGVPVPYCRQLRGVACQSCAANKVSQENDLRLHERTLLGRNPYCLL